MNIRKKIVKYCLITVFASVSTIASAQTADEILGRLSEQAQSYNTINASYQSTLVDLKNDFTEVMSGNILIQGDSFKLDLGDFLIVCDGTTVWTYDKDANECYIDDADILIEDGTDPSKIFTIWEDDFKTELKTTSKYNGKICNQINLYPNDKEEKTYHTIQLFIHDDGSSLEVLRMVIKGREGNSTEYLINNFETGVAIPDGTFQFSSEKFPGAEIIDNRI